MMEPDDSMEILEDSDRDRPSKDDILRSKYIERNFEKIIKILKEPRHMWKRDYVIIALLIVIVLILLVRPGAVNTSKGTHDELIGKIDVLTKKVEHLEKELMILGGLDENSTTEPGTKAPDAAPEHTPDASPAPAPEPSPAPKAAQKPAEKKVALIGKSYKIKDGDTLWIICSHAYQSKNPEIIKALAKYNRLKGPDYDIYPGQTIKIPPKEVLLRHGRKK